MWWLSYKKMDPVSPSHALKINHQIYIKHPCVNPVCWVSLWAFGKYVISPGFRNQILRD